MLLGALKTLAHHVLDRLHRAFARTRPARAVFLLVSVAALQPLLALAILAIAYATLQRRANRTANYMAALVTLANVTPSSTPAQKQTRNQNATPSTHGREGQRRPREEPPSPRDDGPSLT